MAKRTNHHSLFLSSGKTWILRRRNNTRRYTKFRIGEDKNCNNNIIS